MAARRPSPARRLINRAIGYATRDAGHDPSRLTMGRHSYGEPRVLAHQGDTGGRVTVGNYVSIAPHVTFVTGGNHRVDWVTTSPLRVHFDLPGALADGHPAAAQPIEVGSDVWIGRAAWILSGVTIGHGAVVAACSVVTKDVRPYAIVGGNPAKEIRRRFDDETVDKLLATAWWDWPDERVRAHVDTLSSPDIQAFLDAAG